MSRSLVGRVHAALLLGALPAVFSSAIAGTTDPVASYGQNGVVTLPAVTNASSEDVVVSSLVDYTGKAYVLRISIDQQGVSTYSIYRLTGSGSLDSTFGGASGVKITNTTGSYLRYQGLLVDPGRQRFYLVGRDNVGPSIDARRFDGSSDPAFGNAGHLSIESDSNAAAEYASFDSVGRILVGMHSNNKPAATVDTVELARVSASGALDTSFGSAGISRVQFASMADYVNTSAPLELRSSGAIVVPFVKYTCTSSQMGNCSGAPVGTGYVRFPAAGYSTTQSDSTTVKLIAKGNNEPFAVLQFGNDVFRALLSSYDDKTFKVYTVTADDKATLEESVLAPSFAFVTGQNVGLFDDGSFLIGGYGKMTNPSSVQVAKLSGDSLLVPSYPPSPEPLVVSDTSGGGGGAFSTGTLAGLAMLAGVLSRSVRRRYPGRSISNRASGPTSK